MSQTIWNRLIKKENRSKAIKMLIDLNFSKHYLDITKWSQLTPDEKKQILAWYNKNKGTGGWPGDKPGHVAAGKKGAKTRKQNERRKEISKMDATPTPPPTKRPMVQKKNGVKIIPQKTKKSKQEKHHDFTEKNKKNMKIIKTVSQALCPAAALPIEIGFQVITHLDIIRDGYNFNSSPSEELKKPLNEYMGDIVEMTMNATGLPLEVGNISEIVSKASETLQETNALKDLTEVFDFEDYYSNTFNDFYNTSLKNSLNQVLKDDIKS